MNFTIGILSEEGQLLLLLLMSKQLLPPGVGLVLP